MSADALTRVVDGTPVVPATSEDWDEWVSASSTHNHILDLSLLDWLERHRESKGFARDDASGFDERTDFLPFIFRKGEEFEAAVLNHLRTLADVHTVEAADSGYQARRDLEVAEAAFAAIARGEEIIYQGTLRGAETR